LKRTVNSFFLSMGLLAFCFPFLMQTEKVMAQQPGSPRLGAWRVLGPGGGGAQFNPTVSPRDPNLVLVNCDMTGSYLSTNGGESWRMFNLRGVVRFFAFDPVDTNIMYAATQGLYRSSDKGKTWELIYPKPDQVARVVLSGDHADERIVLRDGSQPQIEALSVDPADSQTLFAAISSEKKSGLYLSTDAAKTWTLLGDLPTRGRKVFIDPGSPREQRTLYVAGSNAVSVLEKGNWIHQKSPEGVRGFLDVAAGFPAPGRRPIFYAISGINWRGGETGAAGLYLSEDGGASWQTISTDFLSTAPREDRRLELRAVGTCLTHPETAYLSFRDHSRAMAGDRRFMGVAKTQDLGKTWRMVWQDSDSTAAANVQDPWITERYGPGWGENPFALGISPANPDICFGTDFGRTMRTRDGGKSWQGVYSQRLAGGTYTTTGLDVLTTNGIHFDPFDPRHWFVSFADLGLFESWDSGGIWKEATSRGIPREWINTSYWTVFDPEIKGRIWSVMSSIHDLPRPKMWRGRGVGHYRGGVVISEDGGKTWKPSSEGMGQTAPTHLLLDPKSPANARTLYVCGYGKGVFKSTDGGKNWVLKNAGLDGNEPFAWRMIPDPQGKLYLLVARRSDDGSIGTPLDGALYRSTDGAEHWEKLILPAGCNAPNGMAIDPADPRRLYLAAWGRRLPDGDAGGGIFLSTDAGKSWKSALDKDQHVFDVTLDPKNPQTLYAVGFESSVWKSTNRGEEWVRLKGYNFKWGQRVFPDPLDPKKIYVTTFGGCIWHGPAEGDPNSTEDIVTPIMRLHR
jgi:photosystem II stability/assembly factor-like uncharacterized protein